MPTQDENMTKEEAQAILGLTAAVSALENKTGTAIIALEIKTGELHDMSLRRFLALEEGQKDAITRIGIACERVAVIETKQESREADTDKRITALEESATWGIRTTIGTLVGVLVSIAMAAVALIKESLAASGR
jgi:hypothetical protein